MIPNPRADLVYCLGVGCIAHKEIETSSRECVRAFFLGTAFIRDGRLLRNLQICQRNYAASFGK